VAERDYFGDFFSDIKKLGIDKDATVRFFFVFSRFEFALKQAMYLKVGTRAEPNWECFSNDVKDRYVPGTDKELDNAIAYLCEKPIRRQIVSGDALMFEAIGRGNQTDIEFAIQSVQMIRNNLFHGGKFPSGPVCDPGRDAKLLSSGLVILARCLEWHKNVRKQFFSIDE